MELGRQLLRRGVTWFHHGDCTGADAQAHAVAKQLGIKVKIHPPTNSKHRAHCVGDETDVVRDYMVRNERIVRESKILFVAPRTNSEQIRSGTWATFRMALRLGVETYIIER